MVIRAEDEQVSLNLDDFAKKEEGISISYPEPATPDSLDVVCPHCGGATSSVPGADHLECVECGARLNPVETVAQPTEDDVELDDLAEEHAEADIWDEEYDEEPAQRPVSTVESTLDKERRLFLSGGFFTNVYAGLVSGMLTFFFAVAYGQLAMSQVGLNSVVPQAVGMALVSAALVGLIVSFRSRVPFAIGAPDAVLATLLFLFVGAIYRSMGTGYTMDHIVPTIFAGVALAALVTGFSLWLMGLLKTGRWVRYIPVQILGGVFGAVGVYVLLGAWSLISSAPPPDSNLFGAGLYVVNFMNTPVELTRWVPSVAFGLLLFLGMYRVKHSLAMLAVLLVGVAAAWAAGIWSMPDWFTSITIGIDLPPGDEGGYFSTFLTPGFFAKVQWDIILEHNIYIGGMIVLSMLRIMYRSTSMEARYDLRADLDGEFRAVGLGGMVSSFAGGMPASISYGRTIGNYATGGRGGLSGFIAAAVCGTILFYSYDAMTMIPRFVPEGVLIYTGLCLVRDWVFRTRTAFTRRDDKRLVVVTFLLTLCFGMLIGIGFGVGVAMMITVSRYSRGGAIKNVLSGAVYRSNVDRAPAQLRALKEAGDHIFILRLQGFVFLGTIYDLIDRIQRRVDDSEQLPAEYIIIDFKLVTGFASATHIGFTMLRDLALEHELEIIFTSPPLDLEEHLEKGGYAINDMEGSFKLFMNLDYALEWCENQILDSENLMDMEHQSLPSLLEPVFPDPRYIPALMKVLKKRIYIKGDPVIRQGDSSDTMYFVESGTLNVELEVEGGKTLRLKKVGPGAVFGEMGIYTNTPRSATVRAAEKCIVYQMTRTKLEQLEKRAPVLVTAINRFLINMLADRLADANRKVNDLM
ncbi:SulP family inorganic anion transporter [Salidesulfovibrio onnuriiensis]|uniref:SulP family inorganic anion transporter n=1 Tax=Salidesulfovibrio onnuriiensis TaxID=2583823 RepID=UPI0011CC941C|nr:SulP family inorganic anion transporter [Salidesulfovibrio onnuriiensis]